MNDQNEPLFKPEDVISVYSDSDAVEDGGLVALNSKDRVSRAAFEFLAKHTPMISKPPSNWPVDLMGWFQSEKMSKPEALKLIAKHGKDGVGLAFENIIRDRRAKALASGLLARDGATARRMYEENTDGGIYSIFAKVENDVITELSLTSGEKLWILPNENDGLTLMLPSDY